MTGYMDDSLDRHRTLDVEVLRKPVPINELIRILV